MIGKLKNIVFGALYLISLSVLGQVAPVQVMPQMIPPYSLKLSDFSTASTEKIITTILLTDVVEQDMRIGIRLYIENGRDVQIQSAPVVIGANPITINGGIPLRLSNLDLSPYFQLQNLQGISPQQYNQPLPDGLYQFCFEVYEWASGRSLSQKSCATAYLVLNDPPILNLPNKGELVAEKSVQNIVFQWTPRHLNATNVQYEFTLVELWDAQMDPQAAFLASRPLYQTTTRANTLLYGPSETALIPDKVYGWRVKALVSDGISETSVFRNDGYSEIFYFTYAGNCNEPKYVLAESLSPISEKIMWQGMDHLKYQVQVRKKATSADTNWYEINAYNEYATLHNLEPGTIYQFRVGGQCIINGGYTYSQIYEFTTAISNDNSSTYNCGITPEIIIENKEPLEKLEVNEVFTAGDFPVTVKGISGSNGIFSGIGYIVVPYLQDTKIKVSFNNVKINDDYQLIEGLVVTDYDSSWENVDDIQNEIDAVSEVFEGDLDLVSVAVNFDINPDNFEDYISVNEGGELQIINPETGEVETYSLGDDYVVKDKNEDGTQDIYFVDEEGNVTYGGQEAEGGPISTSETPGFNNEGDIEKLTASGIKVIFSANEDYKYGVDKIITSQESTLNNYYKTIQDEQGNPYNIIHKAIKKSDEDIIIGEIETDNEELIKKLVFKTAQGTKINHSIDGRKVTLNLKGHFSFEYEDVYATIQEEGKTQTIAGVFTLWHLTQKDVNVVLVPLGNAQIPANIENSLQSVYNSAVINLNITKENALNIDSQVWDVEIGNNKLDVGDSGLFSHYTAEQKAIIKYYEQQRGKDSDKYIVFITNITPSRNIQGFMPLKGQNGFVFTGVTNGTEEKKESLLQTIAHELGHGIFGLEHPFSNLKTAEGSTNWLMDYAGGTTFNHMEWAKIHNSGFQLYLFQNEEEGGYTDTEFADKIFQIIQCAYLNSDSNELISFDTSVFGKTGTFYTKWQGDEIWVKIDNGSFEGMPVYEPVELAKNDDMPWRFSLLFKNVEIYTSRYSTGADPVELQKLRKYLFPEDKSQFKKDTEKILTEFLAKSDFTDKDFEKLKSVANCGIQYFTAQQRYSIISKIVENKNITEYYEDLILDLFETRPLENVSEYYSEFLGYLLEGKSEVLAELFTDIDDAGIATLWKGREDNYTRFINALADIVSQINDDAKKWQIVNSIINSDYGDIEDVEKNAIAYILSSTDKNSEIVDKVPAITELFVNMLIDDCEELKDYKIVFDIATLQNSNRELFASFTQSESSVTLNNEKVRVTFGKMFFSWVKPRVFTIKELYEDEREIEKSELGNYYAWSKFLAEDENKYVLDLLDSNPKEYFQILLSQASEYINKAQTENSNFWKNNQTINCKNRESIVNHINTNENSNSLKKVSKTTRLDLLVKMFECNWFTVSDVDAVYDYSEDVLIKLIASFDSSDKEIFQTIENSIGLNKIYDKLYGKRLSKFLAWMGSQIISSNYQIDLSKEDIFKSEGEMFKDSEELLMLESDLFNFKNFSIDDIGEKTIKIDSKQLAYNQMVLVYVSGSFTFLGQKFSKGDVLQMPLIQAFAMSNSNRNIAIEKGAWATVDVVSLAIGVGSIKIVFSVGNTVRKTIVVSDILGSTSGLLANALANDAISAETRFQLNMLALIASTPLLATSSKKIDDMITALDAKISSNAKLNTATKEVLEEHLDKISERIGTSDLKLGNPQIVDNLSDFDKKLQKFINDDVVKLYRKTILDDELITKFPELSVEEIIAIKLYTSGENRNGKTIYKTLNAQLRDGNLDEFYEGMDLLLTNSLKKLPQYNLEKVFRGVSGEEADLARTWKKGDEVDFADYKSTSEDMVMGAYYNVDNEVVYEIINPKGASLSSISYYNNELEVLLQRGQKFKVIDIQENFQINEVINLNTKEYTKITLQTIDDNLASTIVKFEKPVIPEHVWPPPYPALKPGQVRIADLQRLKIDKVTGALQGEVKEAIVNSKVEEILAVLSGKVEGKQLPIVKMAPDPNVPGGFVLIDQTHTYAAYKQLGFDEIPASIYNESDGIPFLIKQEAFNLNNYAPISELKTVPEFSGTPSEQAAKRQAGLEEQKIENTSGSIAGNINGLKEMPVNDLTSIIGSDGISGKGIIKEYADKINKSGYDLENIDPVKIVELPDGTKVIADIDSHYRVAAMIQAGGTNIPAKYLTYDELLKLSPSSKRQREIAELYYVLRIGQQTNNYKSDWFPDMSWEGEKELFFDIPNKVDEFLKQEFPSISRPIPLRSIDQLLDYVDYPSQKKLDLKNELLSSKERARIFGNNPDLLAAWDRLYDIYVSKEFKQNLDNIYAMDAYMKKAEKNYNTIEAEFFNRFVKNQLDSDAYLRSILFSDKLYGGLQVPKELLNDIKPIVAKLDSPQYSGSNKFGSFEIRINGGRIERYFVDESGIGSWKNLNGKTLDDVNFVITNDGKLRIGHGHYNMSGEAETVISSGKLQIVDGKVSEISNFSGHYLPANENLYAVEKVFKGLGITSDDFKLFVNPNAKKIEVSVAPPKYKFEEEGYVYEPEIEIEPDGRKEIFHVIKNKEGEIYNCGESTLSPDGVLENVIYVPENLRKKEISKAIYNNTITDEVKSIKTEYPSEGILVDNFKAFMEEYNISHDKIKALSKTPQAKVLGKDWEPHPLIEIEVKESGINFIWVRKGTIAKPNTTGFKYKFEKEGYQYVPEVITDDLGYKTFKHRVRKNGFLIDVGESRLSTRGVLNNMFEVPENLWEKEISKAMYERLLKEDIKEINAFYMDEPGYSVNLEEFMKTYNATNDLEKAAMATPQGKVIGSSWLPTSIKILNGEVHLKWIKRETIIADNEPWINNLPEELRSFIFTNKEDLYPLFKNADAIQREKLSKSWEVLRNSSGLYQMPEMLMIISKIGDKFKFNGEQGFKALSPLFTSYTKDFPDLKLVSMEMDIIKNLDKLRNTFYNPDNLPINFSCVKGSKYYNPTVLDGIGDELMRFEGGLIVKKKFFDKIDDSYQKIGGYDGFEIYKKGQEIGFKSADIININTNK